MLTMLLLALLALAILVKVSYRASRPVQNTPEPGIRPQHEGELDEAFVKGFVLGYQAAKAGLEYRRKPKALIVGKTIRDSGVFAGAYRVNRVDGVVPLFGKKYAVNANQQSALDIPPPAEEDYLPV